MCQRDCYMVDGRLQVIILRTERNIYEKQLAAIKTELEDCKAAFFVAQNGDTTGRDAHERLIAAAQAADAKSENP